MQLKPPFVQNAAAAPVLAVNHPLPGSGLESAGPRDPSKFARLLEEQGQTSKPTTPVTSAPWAMKSQEPNRPTEAPTVSVKEERMKMGSPQNNRAENTTQATKKDAASAQERKLLSQQQNERNRLQAQREARSTEARNEPRPNPKATLNSTSTASDPTAEASAQSVDQEPAKTPEQTQLSPLALMQWLDTLATNTADPSVNSQPTSASDAAARQEPGINTDSLANLTSVVPGHCVAIGGNEDSSDTSAQGSLTRNDPSTSEPRLANTAASADTALSTPSKSTHHGFTLSPEPKADEASASKSSGMAMPSKLDQDLVVHPSTEPPPSVALNVDRSNRSAPSEPATNPSDFAMLLTGQTGATQTETATTLSVNLPTPAQSPAFREQLGAQVSLLAKDGVQAAEIHLNPADMGPISVQISLNGTQARVDFGADSASTRQLIESGLPELASALREAGLTLTGGGVSQQSRGQADTGQPSEHHQRGHAPEVPIDIVTRAAPIPRRVTLGGVDVYA